ncbi:hypothetical protein DFH11DRAFT_1581794, partial [Phellopilus nigrolimitatus]
MLPTFVVGLVYFGIGMPLMRSPLADLHLDPLQEYSFVPFLADTILYLLLVIRPIPHAVDLDTR